MPPWMRMFNTNHCPVGPHVKLLQHGMIPVGTYMPHGQNITVMQPLHAIMHSNSYSVSGVC